MRGDGVVLACVELLRVVLLGVGEEGVEGDALFEVLDGLHAPDVLQEFEVAEDIDAGEQQPVPVHALEFHVGVVLLEGEVEGLVEVDVGPLDGVGELSLDPSDQYYAAPLESDMHEWHL